MWSRKIWSFVPFFLNFPLRATWNDFCVIGSFTPTPSILSNLDRDKIVMMSVSLRHLQHQTGLLADEGLAGDVWDGGEAADAAGVWEPRPGPSSQILRSLLWGRPDGTQSWQ